VKYISKTFSRMQHLRPPPPKRPFAELSYIAPTLFRLFDPTISYSGVLNLPLPDKLITIAV